MNISDFYCIGKITRPHGLKGEVTLVLNPEAPEDLMSLDVLYVWQAGNLVPYFIENISVKGAKAYVSLQDVDTYDLAAGVSGLEIFLPKSGRPAPAESEFYADEVAGFVVSDGGNHELGKVSEVIRSGLQQLLVVKHGEKEILIPVNGPFIRKVDRQRKTILVELPDGFLEI